MLAMADILEQTNPSYAVKIICPGAVDTALHRKGHSTVKLAKERKNGRVITPEELARKIVKLVHSKKKMLVYDITKNNYTYK